MLSTYILESRISGSTNSMADEFTKWLHLHKKYVPTVLIVEGFPVVTIHHPNTQWNLKITIGCRLLRPPVPCRIRGCSVTVMPPFY